MGQHPPLRTEKKYLGVMAHALNPSSQEAVADGSLSCRPARSTELLPGQPEVHREKSQFQKHKTITKAHNQKSLLVQSIALQCF